MTNFPGNKYAQHIEDQGVCEAASPYPLEMARLHEARVANLLALAREQRAFGGRTDAEDSLAEAKRLVGFK